MLYWPAKISRSFADHSSMILNCKVDKFYTGLTMIIQKHRRVNFEWQFNTFRNERPSRKHFSTSIKPSRTFHVECVVSSINRRRVPYHTRLKSNFDRLLYIIFFITQIHTVCLVSIDGEASRVRPTKKKFWKKVRKKCLEKILKKKFGKKFWKKNLEKSCERKIWKKVLKEKFGKKIWKKNLEISF